MAGVSPYHDVVRCHEASKIRGKMIGRLKCLACCLDWCDKYGKGAGNDRFPPDWAVPLITYPMTKERDLEREKWEKQFAENKKKAQDTAIINGKKVNGCSCGKRNGLQADCELPECQGNELCLLKPYPLCRPSGNAQMYVTPEQAEEIFSYLRPVGSNYDGQAQGGGCKENEPCNPKCVECNSSLRNICKWNPGFFSGGSSGGNGGGYGGNGGGYGGNGGGYGGNGGLSYNSYLFSNMKNPCTSSACNPCPSYPYASWCCQPPC